MEPVHPPHKIPQIPSRDFPPLLPNPPLLLSPLLPFSTGHSPVSGNLVRVSATGVPSSGIQISPSSMSGIVLYERVSAPGAQPAGIPGQVNPLLPSSLPSDPPLLGLPPPGLPTISASPTVACDSVPHPSATWDPAQILLLQNHLDTLLKYIFNI